MTWTFFYDFVPSAQEGSTLNLVTIGPVASEEMVEIVLGQKSKDDLDLVYL